MHRSCVLKGGSLKLVYSFTQATGHLLTSYFTQCILMYTTNYVTKISPIRQLLSIVPPWQSKKGNKIKHECKTPQIGLKISGKAQAMWTINILKNEKDWMQGRSGN